MDYRCPACGASLARRKLSHAVVARMEMDCAHCKDRIRLNIHPAETVIVLFIFGIIVLLAVSTNWFPSQSLVLFALGAAMAGALALALLEHIWLRTWPRYASIARKPRP